MDILRDKIVTIRKKHNCDACAKVFNKGSKMRLQVTTYDGIYNWRSCLTCDELMQKHPFEFKDPDNVFYENCVHDRLDDHQSPEELLEQLNNYVIK